MDIKFMIMGALGFSTVGPKHLLMGNNSECPYSFMAPGRERSSRCGRGRLPLLGSLLRSLGSWHTRWRWSPDQPLTKLSKSPLELGTMAHHCSDRKRGAGGGEFNFLTRRLSGGIRTHCPFKDGPNTISSCSLIFPFLLDLLCRSTQGD